MGAAIHFAVEMIEQFTRCSDQRTITNKFEIIATVIDPDAQAPLNLFQVCIERATESGQLVTVVGLQDNLVRFRVSQIHK